MDEVQAEASLHAENVRRAHDLREKALQLARDEHTLINQALELNLMAKTLAEATLRPPPAPRALLPLFIPVAAAGAGTAGMVSPVSLQMQLVHAGALSSGCMAAAAAHQADVAQLGGHGTLAQQEQHQQASPKQPQPGVPAHVAVAAAQQQLLLQGLHHAPHAARQHDGGGGAANLQADGAAAAAASRGADGAGS